MFSHLHFLQSDHVIALLIATLIFLITIFLVIKRWIGFSITLLLLLFSLAAGFIIDQHYTFPNYFQHPALPSTLYENETSREDFHKQVLQAIDNLKIEVLTEKENLRLVKNQLQDVVNSVDTQKQKLENFIEETSEKQQIDSPHVLIPDK